MTHDEAETELTDLRHQVAILRVATALLMRDAGMELPPADCGMFGLATQPEQIYLNEKRCCEILESREYKTDAFRTPASEALH